MDLNALMGAAAQDPKAAAFLQQMLAGGSSPVERIGEINPQSLRVPGIADVSGDAPLPVYDPAKKLMDQLLGKYDPTQVAAGAAPQQGPMPSGGTLDQMGAPPAAIQVGGGIPPVEDVTQQALPLSPEQQQQQVGLSGLGGGQASPENLTSLFQMLLMGA